MSDPHRSVDCATALPRGVEWGTLVLILACYGLWLLVLFLLPGLGLGLSVLCLGGLAALHSSLSHEALHGHPFRRPGWNEALLFLPLSLFIPYGRFRDTHLAHHRDDRLTDPYDDPESNFQDPEVWAQMPGWHRLLLQANNTLLGRVLLGPFVGQICFMIGDWRLMRGQDRNGEHRVVLRDWGLHGVGLGVVITITLASPTPLWVLFLGGYIGLALLKIRTFLEHRAHAECHSRTVVVEDRGPLAWLFLHNNLHIVHHMYPGVPWHALPRLYRENRDLFLSMNQGYHYKSYGQVFLRYLLRSKDPVPHPLWSSED